MPDREKIRKALESLRDRLWDAAKQDAIATLDASMVTDAIALLKEQEARVIDISEIYTAKNLDLWIEHKSENIVHPIMLIETEMTNKSQTVFFYPMLAKPIKTYGKTWRCWTARPTDAQRKAAKWNGSED